MSPRIKRAQRLVELGDKAEQASRVRATAAARAVAAAREQAESDESSWASTARKLSGGVVSVSDLEEQAAYLKTLRLRADASAVALGRSVAEERAALAAVMQAATERRKLELWRDRIVDGQRNEELRLERVAEDALAASRASTGAKP